MRSKTALIKVATEEEDDDDEDDDGKDKGDPGKVCNGGDAVGHVKLSRGCIPAINPPENCDMGVHLQQENTN